MVLFLPLAFFSAAADGKTLPDLLSLKYWGCAGSAQRWPALPSTSHWPSLAQLSGLGALPALGIWGFGAGMS